MQSVYSNWRKTSAVRHSDRRINVKVRGQVHNTAWSKTNNDVYGSETRPVKKVQEIKIGSVCSRDEKHYIDVWCDKNRQGMITIYDGNGDFEESIHEWRLKCWTMLGRI